MLTLPRLLDGDSGTQAFYPKDMLRARSALYLSRQGCPKILLFLHLLFSIQLHLNEMVYQYYRSPDGCEREKETEVFNGLCL